jgi:hypothetical protein
LHHSKFKKYAIDVIDDRYRPHIGKQSDMVQSWISYKGPLILCLGLIRRPFNQDCVFPWNLACFSQPWFVHDDGFGPISLMVYSAKLGQPMCGFDLGSKAGLLGAYIWSDLG